VAITSKIPDVEVWLGDRKLGETARGGTLLATDLPVGTYQLKARKPGYKNWTRTVDVGTGQRVELAIEIEARPSSHPRDSAGWCDPAGEF
jgi:hypothetical protein